MTVAGVLSDTARRCPDNVAFVFDDARETYAEVAERSAGEARCLLGAGVRPGDRVGILMPNCADFIHVLFAAGLIGALAVPINSRLAPRELRHVISHSGVKVLVTTDAVEEFADYASRLHLAFDELARAPEGVTPAVGDLTTVVRFGSHRANGMIDRNAWAALGQEVGIDEVRQSSDAVLSDDSYIMMYTSGTAAQPKGCPLSHRAVIQAGRGVGDVYEIGPADRMWNPLPLFHVSAQAPLFAVVAVGASWLSTAHFDPKTALDAITEEGATILWPAYPTLTEPLLALPSYRPETLDAVRIVLTVGPPDLLRSYQARMPRSRHVSCYGSTELGGAVVVGRPADSLDERLTCGRPLPGVELEIRDVVTHERVPAHALGAIWVRGFNLFKGYWDDPQATARVMDADGWFNTEDLGSVDETGALSYLGRLKDMLKVGGENVASIELESYLCAHPGVAMAAVVGIPDAKYTEVPAAFVELRGGEVVTEEEILRYCREGLAKFKVPRYVRFVTEWPMSLTKIRKYELRDGLIAELG